MQIEINMYLKRVRVNVDTLILLLNMSKLVILCFEDDRVLLLYIVGYL